MGKGDEHSESEATRKLTTACPSSDHRCEEALAYTCIVEGANTLENNLRGDMCSYSECISIAPYLSTAQECESANSYGEGRDSKDLKREQGQPEYSTTGIPAVSEFIVSSSESSQQDDRSFSVEEENFDNEEGKVNLKLLRF